MGFCVCCMSNSLNFLIHQSLEDKISKETVQTRILHASEKVQMNVRRATEP